MTETISFYLKIRIDQYLTPLIKYNSNDTKAYDEMIQGLLDYFDKTSKKYEPKENLGLAFRLICYRYSRNWSIFFVMYRLFPPRNRITI